MTIKINAKNLLPVLDAISKYVVSHTLDVPQWAKDEVRKNNYLNIILYHLSVPTKFKCEICEVKVQMKEWLKEPRGVKDIVQGREVIHNVCSESCELAMKKLVKMRLEAEAVAKTVNSQSPNTLETEVQLSNIPEDDDGDNIAGSGLVIESKTEVVGRSECDTPMTEDIKASDIPDDGEDGDG